MSRFPARASYIRSDVAYTPLTHQDFSDGVGEWPTEEQVSVADGSKYEGPSWYDWRMALADAEAEDAAQAEFEFEQRVQENIDTLEQAEEATDYTWGLYRKIAEAERHSSELPMSSLAISLDDPRALLVLDQARTILTCLQVDGDTVGKLIIEAFPSEAGRAEYVITVRP